MKLKDNFGLQRSVAAFSLVVLVCLVAQYSFLVSMAVLGYIIWTSRIDVNAIDHYRSRTKLYLFRFMALYGEDFISQEPLYFCANTYQEASTMAIDYQVMYNSTVKKGSAKMSIVFMENGHIPVEIKHGKLDTGVATPKVHYRHAAFVSTKPALLRKVFNTTEYCN
jgi:hypothetical protein